MSAQSQSSAPVTYSIVAGPATIAANVVTLNGAGSITIEAMQKATVDYTSAEATMSFLVTPESAKSVVAPLPGHVFGDQGRVTLEAEQAGGQDYNPTSATVAFEVRAPSISISPSILTGGTVALSVAGRGFAPGATVVMDGRTLVSRVVSPELIEARGFLPPWKSKGVLVEVYGPGGGGPIAERFLPITPSAVPYDAAARFMTQAAFGPRPGVEHIQSIGLDAFITEQFQQPIVTYDPVAESSYFTFIMATSQGNSLLRMRVAWALQNIFVPQGASPSAISVPIERTFETYADLNFRDLMTAVVSDPNIGWFLDLMANPCSVQRGS